MENDEIDDIFKDFERKVADKNETGDYEEETSEDDLLKRKYQKAEEALKEKHKKETEAMESDKKEKSPKHETLAKSLGNTEKIAYIAIILVLALYIAIDLSFYHGSKGAGLEKDQAVTAAVVKGENKTNESEKAEQKIIEEEKEPAKEEKNDTAVKEEKKLSGKIALTIDNIYTEVADKDSDLGYISKIVFTVDNGKDKALTPVVDVYAYDSKLDKLWETKSRGHYTYAIGIKPGDQHTASIDLSPKTFKNLDLEKNIRLTLNDTKEGFITAVNEEVLIS